MAAGSAAGIPVIAGTNRDEFGLYLQFDPTFPLLDEAFTHPPRPELTPAQTYQRLLRGGTEPVRLAELAKRTVATQVVTTPPGIPVLMPGENTGDHDDPTLRYLRALEDFDRHFPGFPSETHGVARDGNGDYWITCLRTS